MAATRSRIPVGSAPWIVSESRQAAEIIAQDAEEFSYSVCNDMEWLNEHMAEIFAPGNINVANVFKTPGKLRGKTPRTIRKRAAPGNRAPLADIFAPNSQAPTPSKYLLNKPPNPVQIAEDSENQHGLRQSPAKMAPLPRMVHTDSGYHGTTDDEMDVDKPVHNIAQAYVSPMRVIVAQDVPAAPAEQRRSLSESFVSAKEILGSRKTSQETANAQSPIVEHVEAMVIDSVITAAPEHVVGPAIEDQMALDDIQSPPDSPSPVKQVVRKSSLTFAALPAREPLAKTSFGPRASQSSKSFGARNSQLRTTGSRITGGASHATFSFVGGDTEIDIDVHPESLRPEESDTTKIHNKTSTQRLHDKINMLGQSREVRTSQLNASTDKPMYSLLPPATEKAPEEPKPIGNQSTISLVRQVEEDDWIAPLTRPATAFESSLQTNFTSYDMGKIQSKAPESRIGTESPGRSFLYKKNASTTVLESPTKATMAPDASGLKPISVSNPAPVLAAGTTTPTESPPRSPSGRKLLEGPLSASKAKFYSVLKSAKGIFASSAGVSAHAKMEALSPGRFRKQAFDEPPRSPGLDVQAMPAYFPDSRPASPVQSPQVQEGRRTRSSTEQKRREEERKRQQQRSADELDKAREKEKQKAAAAAVQKINRSAAPSRIAARPGAPSRAAESKETLRSDPDDVGPPPPPKNNLPANSQRLREPRRVPVPRSNKEAASKLKPAPVTVRMPSQRLGPVPQSNVTLNQSLHDTLPPPPPPKTGMATKTTGITSHPNTSATSLRSNAGSVKRAFGAAAKKKEMETKHAQRKAEQKREIEQKRAQRIEEERKLEQQRKVAEQQRVQEARKAAQRKAEEAKRVEQQRTESRQNALANALQQEKSNQHPRGDVGTSRPLGKMDQRPIVQVNPAKPPKRAHPMEADEQEHRSGPSFQQTDSKRRKTEDEEPAQTQRSSVMAPPIRHSTIRKDPNKFQHSYLQNHTAQHGSQSMLIKTVTSQHMQHKSTHGEMAKFANGRIPFADTPNPPAAPIQPLSSQMQYKTPVRGGNAAPTPVAKPSPQYPPSESIILPEINTDSEDDGSDAEGFQAPDWTRTPELRALLEKQQLVDPETVFGPIAPLHMEEVFSRGSSKERLKKFRERTSSANWNGADRLTEEERRKDRKARERLMRDGGWDFRNQKEAMGENSPNA